MVIFRPPKQHTKLEETHVVYHGEEKKAELQEFIKKNLYVHPRVCSPLSITLSSPSSPSLPSSLSMGLAGVRTQDNSEYFDAKKPLAVVYFNVDYTRNPKGNAAFVQGRAQSLV